MKIITAQQTHELDAYTIEKEPIPSIDLMERASYKFVRWFVTKFKDLLRPVVIFCGPGNNGGDGLAIARLLHHKGYIVEVVICKISDNTSEDFDINLGRLPQKDTVMVRYLEKGEEFPGFPPQGIIIDAIFGSGLNRPVEGYWAGLLEHLNGMEEVERVAVDIPSGMFADQLTESVSFRAHFTFSFELPKLGFFFPENFQRVGHWEVRSIGLSQEYLQQLSSPNEYVDEQMAKSLLRRRGKFDHKGHYGHALLICGSYGKVGAAVLASRACLRSGAGLLSIHAPQCAYTILQTTIPEAMVSVDLGTHFFSQAPELDKYKGIGIGSGLDKEQESRTALAQLLEKTEKPLVIDADALNIIAEEKRHEDIPKNSILTPHPKEFERLFGPSKNGFERMELARKKAKEHQLHIVLKGAHTMTACPDGTCYFNGSGNPGMATGGSGDVLTGVITSLVAQGYAPKSAAIFGVYLHGRAGDLAVEGIGEEALIAGDIVDFLGKAFLSMR